MKDISPGQENRVDDESAEKIRKLEADLAAKTEFCSMVSHELRTPLVPILGYTRMLLDGTYGSLPDSLRAPLETIRDRANALKRLIDDLLELWMLDGGTLSIEPERVPVRERLLSLLRPYHEIDLGKPVSIELEGEGFDVWADPQRLDQVVQNLIENAIKYSKDSVRIKVTLSAQGRMGRIEVRDDGIGIPERHLPHIFERFYQAEGSGMRLQTGVGLGLAVAKELVEKMSGRISVKSEPGAGTVFMIELPLTGEITAPPGPHEAGDEPTTSSATCGRTSFVDERDKYRVIVVDDDPVMARLVSAMLKDRYEVVGATSGREGLDLIRRSGADLVLLDWIMPGMDGLSVLSAIKSDPAAKNIPVILLSGNAEVDAVKQGLMAGAVDYIVKPFAKADLIGRIEASLSRA